VPEIEEEESTVVSVDSPKEEKLEEPQYNFVGEIAEVEASYCHIT
jgi:hypothetical protein